MKKTYLVTLLIAFLITNIAFAQFAIINDKDGFSNIRSAATIADNIVDKLTNNSLVYCLEPTNNWLSIDYKKDNQTLSGYIYKDRLRYLSEFENIPLSSKTSVEAIFLKDKIKVSVKTTKFDTTTAKVTYQEPNKSFVSKINGLYAWGTDGNLPNNQYASILVVINGKTIELPNTAFSDLFDPRFEDMAINYDKKTDNLYIVSQNSDGAGGYAVIWTISKGVYKERFVLHGF